MRMLGSPACIVLELVSNVFRLLAAEDILLLSGFVLSIAKSIVFENKFVMLTFIRNDSPILFKLIMMFFCSTLSFKQSFEFSAKDSVSEESESISFARSNL